MTNTLFSTTPDVETADALDREPSERPRRAVGASASIGLLAVRLVTGTVLAAHGIQSLISPGQRLASTEQLGLPYADLAAWLSMVGEAGLGVMLVLGMLTRVAGLLTATLMGLTWALVHLPQGLIGAQLGINGENALLIGAVGLALLFTGPGAASLDRAMFRHPAG